MRQPSARLTLRALNRSTLHRQLLLAREPLGVVDAVARIVALQAQEPVSPYVALWTRIAGFDPAELDAAFADGTVVKATLMRITLHAVTAADHPPLREAMRGSLRAARLNDRRFRSARLSITDADALVPDLLAFASQPRTNAEAEAWLEERLGPLPKPSVWWALRSFAPLVHAPTGGPWSFGPRPSYIAARTDPTPGDREGSLRHLVRRYLEGFGPATVADIAQFALIPRSTVREVVASMGELRSLAGPSAGLDLLDVPDGRILPEDAPAPPRLMAMWDSTLLAYADRSRLVPPDYRRLVARNNGDLLPTVLVDGFVAGVWRTAEGGIEITAFEPLSGDAWADLETEARALSTFLAERDPSAYRRYAHWWSTLPGVDVRVLGRTPPQEPDGSAAR